MEVISISHLWNLVLTALLGVTWYFVRGKLDELVALRVELANQRNLLAETREEMARSTITRQEFSEGMKDIRDRLEHLRTQLVRNGGD